MLSLIISAHLVRCCTHKHTCAYTHMHIHALYIIRESRELLEIARKRRRMRAQNGERTLLRKFPRNSTFFLIYTWTSIYFREEVDPGKSETLVFIIVPSLLRLTNTIPRISKYLNILRREKTSDAKNKGSKLSLLSY